MLRDWLTAVFFCTVFLLVFRLVLRLVSVVSLWIALPAVGYALVPAVGYALLPAVGCALLPAVGFALLGSFHHFSFFSTLSAALRAHRRFDVLLAILVPVLLLYLLFTTGSSAVVLSLILPRDTLWQVTSSWMPRLHLQHHHSALRPS